MKILLLTLLLVNCVFASQAQNSSGKTTEEAAIKNVITNESKGYYTQNRKLWADSWAHAPYISWSGNGSPGQILVQNGWTAYSEFFREYFSSKQTDPVPTIEYAGFKISNLRNIATAIYTQTTKYADGTSSKSEQVRVLEKQGSTWKLIYVNSRKTK